MSKMIAKEDENPDCNREVRRLDEGTNSAPEGTSSANFIPKHKDKADFEMQTSYKMNHAERGIALIFNCENFTNKRLHKRDGAKEDGRVLSDTLKDIGFDVRLFNDLKLEDMRKEIAKVANTDHTNHDCLLVAFMTHGEDNDRLFATDFSFKVDEVTETFETDRVPSLTGKPKIFIFQACRGNRKVEISTLSEDSGTAPESVKCFSIPAVADFFVLCSSTKGYASMRNTTSGSWFIQDFCTELKQDARTRDLVTIATNTLRRVAFRRHTVNESNIIQQMPIFMSTLTRFLYFYPQ